MDGFRAFILSLLSGDFAAIVSLLTFLAGATVALAVGVALQGRATVRRRAATISADGGPRSGAAPTPKAGRRAADKLGEYASKHMASMDADAQRLLRKRMIQAGFLSPRAAGVFLLSRFAALAAMALATHFATAALFPEMAVTTRWLLVGGGALVGYYLPQVYLDRRIQARQAEHRNGFPDFMDLMVVCSDAGLSMESALDRVGRELADSYPSLSANVYMAILEMRAGRPLSEALERLGDRLGIDEARSFATLLQQSEELGTSLTETLRVYSDDMRHQRLSRAEEKAYSLPAKLSVPLTVCIFPVVMVVTLLPVIVRFRDAGF